MVKTSQIKPPNKASRKMQMKIKEPKKMAGNATVESLYDRSNTIELKSPVKT
jgi:hypothetical protein